MKKWLSLLFIGCLSFGFYSLAEASNLQDEASFYTTAAFLDVPKSDKEEYYAIQWAFKNGIVSGDKGNFNPNGKLKESHFIKMYSIYFGLLPTNAKTDPSDWTNTYYAISKKYSVPANGYTNKAARSAEVKRGTVAQMLAYALGKPTDLNSATSYLMANDISTAQNPTEETAAAQFGVDNSLTRKQAALFLYRMYKKDITELNVSTPYNTVSAKEFFLGGKAIAKVVDAKYKSLELQFISENKVFGGYLTKEGQTFEGYTIGSVLKGSQNIIVNGKNLTIFIDTVNQNKIDAIYWVEDSSFGTLQTRAIQDDFSEKKFAALESLMLAITNVSRAKNNIPALLYEKNIAAVAKGHSQYMLQTGDFAHTTKAGQTVQDRLNSIKKPYLTGGENLASGSPTVFSAHNRFMNSIAHRPNILDSEYEQAGIGIAINAKAAYYTVNFITYQ